MCGIAGIYVKDPNMLTKKAHDQMERMLDELLLGIENRGTDATGFVAVSNKKAMVLDKSPRKASDFVKVRKKFPEDARLILGHTRLATQGDPSNWLNNHPVIYEGIMVTHNGVITNDDAIFKDIKRYGEVDTEAIAAILKKDGLENAGEALSKLTGGFACAAFDVNNPEELLLFRRGSANPLVYHQNKQFIVWASTALAIKEAWGKVLGTPPEWARFEHLDSGSILHIKNEDMEETKDAIKGSSFRSNTSNWSGWEPDEEWDLGASCESPYLLDRNARQTSSDYLSRHTSINDLLKRNGESTDKLKEAGAVVNSMMPKDRKAITFAYRTKVTDEVKKLLGNSPKWDHCKVCKTTVARITTKNHSMYGSMCDDCYDFLTTVQEIGPARSATEAEIIDGIEEWVQLESWIHYNTLVRVSDKTGITVHAIDHLLYRASDAYLKKDEIKKLYLMLKAEYDEQETVVWELYGETFDTTLEVDEDEDNAGETDGVLLWDNHSEVDESLWVSCAAGLHKKDEDCVACNDVKAEIAILTGQTVVGDKPQRTSGLSIEEQITRPATPERNPVWRAKRYETPSTMWKPGDPIKGREKRDGKCLLCPKNSKVLIDQDFRWCSNHFNFCGMLADDGSDCSNETTGWDENGVRLCHHHSRGVKNFLTQKTLKNIRNRSGRSKSTV